MERSDYLMISMPMGCPDTMGEYKLLSLTEDEVYEMDAKEGNFEDCVSRVLVPMLEIEKLIAEGAKLPTKEDLGLSDE